MPPSQSLRLLRESTLTTNAEKEVPRTTGMYLANPTNIGNESSMPWPLIEQEVFLPSINTPLRTEVLDNSLLKLYRPLSLLDFYEN